MRHHGSDSGPGSEAVTTVRPAVAPGDRLKDRYDVVGRIGSGGMADVFEGIDNLFQRDVAIKVLRPERVDEVMQRRVLRDDWTIESDEVLGYFGRSTEVDSNWLYWTISDTNPMTCYAMRAIYCVEQP